MLALCKKKKKEKKVHFDEDYLHGECLTEVSA